MNDQKLDTAETQAQAEAVSEQAREFAQKFLDERDIPGADHDRVILFEMVRPLFEAIAESEQARKAAEARAQTLCEALEKTTAEWADLKDRAEQAEAKLAEAVRQLIFAYDALCNSPATYEHELPEIRQAIIDLGGTL